MFNDNDPVHMKDKYIVIPISDRLPNEMASLLRKFLFRLGGKIHTINQNHTIYVTWSSTAGPYFMASTVAAARYSSAPGGARVSAKRRAKYGNS